MKRLICLLMILVFVFSAVPSFVKGENTDNDIKLYGDADSDGEITTEDAVIILKMCIDVIVPTDEQTALTDESLLPIDANKSGAVTTADATFILKVTAGMIEPYTYHTAPWQLTMPAFEINTENGEPVVSKENYIRGELTITNADEKYMLTNEPLQIRGRGNYSWSGTEKKSYRIKFDDKINLMGQGKAKAKSWTLLAVHCDKTLLRTDAAYYFASKLENIPFVSSSSFMELTLNGEYLGVYEVCDQIQVGAGRVNIDDSGSGVDIGYLVELDRNASEDVIEISNGNTFEVKSDYKNQAQLRFITDYLSQCFEAIERGNREEVEALVDINSAVDCYIVEEFMKNLDVGWGSFYFTKPDGDKLYFGPVWDFDLCAGNAEDDYYDPAFKSYRYTYVGNPYFDYMQQHDWYIELRECDWFNELVTKRWEEVKPYAEETVEHIGEIAYKYQPSFEQNFVRWDIFDKKINREPAEILHIHSFMGQVEYLRSWLTNRINWLSLYYAGKAKDITY